MGLRGWVERSFRVVAAHRHAVVLLVAAFLWHPPIVQADGHDRYRLSERFTLPVGAGPLDALADGRLITVVGADVFVETASGSRIFTNAGALPAADMASFGAAFVLVSPDGTSLAVGNNGGASFGNYQVGVFSFPSLTGDWFDAPHLLACWVDNTDLALTAGDFGFPSRVTVLDTTSANPSIPDNPTIIDNVGGASGGVAIDQAGNLFTGNGFTNSGPSGTGLIKAFTFAQWTGAIGGTPLDFEAEGIEVVDVLSASPMEFDSGGNLLVGGGEFAAAGQFDYVAVVSAGAIADALAGGGPINTHDFAQVRRLDPDASNGSAFYTFAYGSNRSEIYVNDFGDLQTHVFRDLMGVPAASTWGLAILFLALCVGGTVALQGRAKTVLSLREISP